MTVSPQSSALGSFDFDRATYELVCDTAPRLFAVVAEYAVGTEDQDAVVVAWGLAYEDGKVEVTQIEGGRRWRLEEPDHVMRYIRPSEDCSPRLVWLAPAGTAASHAQDEAA
ncbi:hypothetical protein [Streptomyces sp. NPDC088725]|uniref:hypothetical protein n=1 Tax=Streptomyces sp. NPDC088725 TaxID=3365873 RepID=UPI00382B226F